jgi:urease subunit gamma/beta
MRLLPTEQERLLLFLAAELARSRRARGLRLNQAEATAIVADAVCEAARDGRSYAEAQAAGRVVLGEADVLDGVRALVPRVEVEALFGDGRRLVVLDDPLGNVAEGPERARGLAGETDLPPVAHDAEPEIEWLQSDTAITVVNEGDVTIGVTSHLHVFEANRRLRFDRAAAWGMRLALPARAKCFFAPGAPREVRLVPIGGDRIVRGHGDLVDGPLDAPGARDAALAAARERGYLGA